MKSSLPQLSMLENALRQKKLEFSQEEWEAFGIMGLRTTHFIKVGANHFKPAEGMEALERTMVQQQFTNNESTAICATTAKSWLI